MVAAHPPPRPKMIPATAKVHHPTERLAVAARHRRAPEHGRAPAAVHAAVQGEAE